MANSEYSPTIQQKVPRLVNAIGDLNEAEELKDSEGSFM
jgi:hypothetical protein